MANQQEVIYDGGLREQQLLGGRKGCGETCPGWVVDTAGNQSDCKASCSCSGSFPTKAQPKGTSKDPRDHPFSPVAVPWWHCSQGVTFLGTSQWGWRLPGDACVPLALCSPSSVRSPAASHSRQNPLKCCPPGLPLSRNKVSQFIPVIWRHPRSLSSVSVSTFTAQISISGSAGSHGDNYIYILGVGRRNAISSSCSRSIPINHHPTTTNPRKHPLHCAI